MINIVPREFQAASLERVKDSQSNRILITAPTGAGKAILLMLIADYYLSQGKKVLLLVDRIVLIEQLSKTATECRLLHNILHGKVLNLFHHLTVGSIQTLNARQDQYDLNEWDIILIDEAHILHSKMEKSLSKFNGRKIGVTATPFTRGIDLAYDVLINCTTANELTRLGILAPLRPYTFRKINMEGANTIGGEWAPKEVQQRSRQIYGDVVETYVKCVKGLRSLCFCANVAHCKEVASKFTEAGIPVGIYAGDVLRKKKKRRQLLDDFDNKRIWILISVSALAKGFDKPYVECILDLRPLRRSLSEYMQMVGRGTRSYPGKKECYLLDFTGNIDRFLPDMEYIYFHGVKSLTHTKRLNRIRTDSESKNSIRCPSCGNPMFFKCSFCGYERLLKNPMLEVDTENIKLERVECFKNAPEVVTPQPSPQNVPKAPKKGFFTSLSNILRSNFFRNCTL